YPRLGPNNGNGAWAPIAPAAMPSQSTISIVHAVDFEGDGRPDLLRLGWGGTGADIGYKSFLNRTAFPPTIESLSNIVTRVNTPIAVTVSVGSGVGGAGVLTVAASSANTTLVPNV